MPEGLVKKHEEKLWQDARAEVEERQKKKLKKKKLSEKDIPWALVNFIFQKKKNKKTASVIQNFERIARSIIESRDKGFTSTGTAEDKAIPTTKQKETCKR